MYAIFYILFLFVTSAISFLHSYDDQKFPSLQVIFTAALIEDQYEMRKNEYLHSLSILKSHEISPFIVEACKQNSFFDFFNYPVFYPCVNDLRLKNKGVNEAKLLRESLHHFPFDDDSILIKLTGRYFFNDSHFFKVIESHAHADIFVKKPDHQTLAIFTGCFAMRAKYFRQFLNGLDFERMEEKLICIEDELGRFLQQNPIMIEYIEHISIN